MSRYVKTGGPYWGAEFEGDREVERREEAQEIEVTDS